MSDMNDYHVYKSTGGGSGGSSGGGAGCSGGCLSWVLVALSHEKTSLA